ncbi:MAG: hypothetical protein CMJ50_00170 [Planctomycetaceae bacterium]|nr:hypothetical protein [Planctomycetaceae bacterium]
MPVSRAKKVEVARRRETVADFYVQGWTQSAIAQRLGLTQPTICSDLKIIQGQWRESAIRDFDLLRERELRKLDRLEREAWAAWERSQEPSQQAVISTNGDDQRTQETTKDQTGDARYLDVVSKCITSRRALLGLDAPTRIAPTSPDGEEAYHSHVMAKLMQLAESAGAGREVVDSEFITNVVEQQRIEDSEHPNDKHEGNGTE